MQSVCPPNFQTIVVKCSWEYANQRISQQTEWIMGNWKIENVKCSLGKWVGTRQKFVENRSQKKKPRQQLRLRDRCIGILLLFRKVSSITKLLPTSGCNILSLANWFYSCIFSAVFLLDLTVSTRGVARGGPGCGVWPWTASQIWQID